jgi:hypothetical protein
VSPQSTQQLLSGPALREFILLAGKDSVGKSSAVVSLAWYIEQTQPNASFYVLDTENKFKSALKGFGTDAPNNISYYKCETMNDLTAYTAEVLAAHRPGDWLSIESMSRAWERAQNLGYESIAGLTKAEYLDRRPKSGKGSGPIPEPDRFWDIVKGAHDGNFVDLLSQSDTLNVLMTTTIAKPKKDTGFIKENADRKAIRVELGIDVGLEGAPRLPYFMETLCLLERANGAVSCRVLRDNLSVLEDSRVEFQVPGRKDWGMTFWATCR